MMKRLILCFFALALIFLAGCKEKPKEQIVFPPDANAVQTVGGYKSQIVITPKEATKNETKYYYNESTKKFHSESCRYASSCGGHFKTDKAALLNDGYVACKICKP